MYRWGRAESSAGVRKRSASRQRRWRRASTSSGSYRGSGRSFIAKSRISVANRRTGRWYARLTRSPGSKTRPASSFARCRRRPRTAVRSSAGAGRIERWKSRSAGVRKAVVHTASMTSRSCLHGARATPTTSTSPGSSGPTSLSCRCWLRRWTGSSRRRPPGSSASSAASAVLNLEGIFTRYEDADEMLERISTLPKDLATREMQEIYTGAGQGGVDRPADR